MNLRDYQSKYVQKLTNSFRELAAAGNKGATIIFKSPTGSGKTVMVAAMLQQLSEDNFSDNYVFIWASMGDLAHQSYEKLSQNYLKDSRFNMYELNEITAEALEPNTILFCNWEKMYQVKQVKDDDDNLIEIFNNVYVRVGEDGRNLQEILDKTRAEGYKIVLIVDEAHRTYTGENSQKLVNKVIQPDLIMEVSATPLIALEAGYYEKNIGRYIEVPFEDVVKSGLIKNNTIINNDIAGVINNGSTDKVILEAALKQREVLAQKYKEQSIDINPLILVQLPNENADKMSSIDQTTRELVENFMEEHGITYDNGKLGIWVAGEKYPDSVKESCTKNDSPIEVLIFKQAIATGWDCPRAAILVMLRDIKSVIFEIQTVGRILRMPELKHYEDSALNSAYVFTNINELALRQDEDTQTFFKMRFSHKKKDIDNFVLPNVHRQRVVGQRHRLNQTFRPIFLQMFDKKFGIIEKDDKKARRKKVDVLLKIYADELMVPILADISIEELDLIDAKAFQEGQKLNIAADNAFIERTFQIWLKKKSSPYAPHDSSRILKQALYKWFSDNGFDDEDEVQRIVACSEENQRILNGIIDEAKQEFDKTMTKETELTLNTFSIPEEQEFGEHYETYPSLKHALQPFYRPDDTSGAKWDTERNFEEALDESKKVEWWYRNGTNEPKYFGVPYIKHKDNKINDEAIFYPDYIVKFTDGTIGVFDTKSGDTTNPETKMGNSVNEKADALQGFFIDYDNIVDTYQEFKIDGITSYPGLWGGIINVTGKNTFMLQGDAVTRETALAAMNGDRSKIEEIKTKYSADNWITLDI